MMGAISTVDGTAYRRGWVLTDYTAAEVRDRLTRQVNESVRERIEAIIPQSSQLRAMSRASYLLRRMIAGDITQEQQAEAQALESLEADTLQPIRDHGATLKAALADAATVDDLLRIDIDAGWPV